MKTATINQTQQNLTTYVDWVIRQGQDVVIQNQGQDEVVLIPFADYGLLQEARARKRRQETAAALRQLVEGQEATAVSEAEAWAWADQITREAIHTLQTKG